jgi:thioredoxin
MAEPLVIGDDSFEDQVLGSEKPVLVDFWAEWCGPCHMIAPSVQEIADEQEKVLTVAKMDIDENPMTPGRYGVMGIPTLYERFSSARPTWTGALFVSGSGKNRFRLKSGTKESEG